MKKNDRSSCHSFRSHVTISNMRQLGRFSMLHSIKIVLRDFSGELLDGQNYIAGRSNDQRVAESCDFGLRWQRNDDVAILLLR
mmetsp:Transcript_33298/g.105118  ORF Transcript_33298/g.105118 Transcript_33298/m.105118 type:complete len:83 (-) Transcript_33298:212-460(-)